MKMPWTKQLEKNTAVLISAVKERINQAIDETKKDREQLKQAILGQFTLWKQSEQIKYNQVEARLAEIERKIAWVEQQREAAKL
jgi:putative SOS response-associated peptidase YedK